MERKIKRYFAGVPSMDGAGVRLTRMFGYNDIEDFDPFLMMDFFDSTNPEDYIKGFPWHPHRGIETVTYLIAGKMKHEDSLGNRGVIEGGDCQWMTAGSGILHQEIPKESPLMLGIQLWINLPKKDKMTKPNYGNISKEMIPVYSDDKMKIHIIAGEYKGLVGPVPGVKDVEPIFLDVELEADSEFVFNIEPKFTAFAFLIRGEANFNVEKEEIVSYPKVVLYEEGETIKVNTKEKPARFLLIAGKKLKEPVAWGGPIVMNTKEEVEIAFKELRENKFIK